MSVTAQVWLALAILAGQGLALGALLVVVRTFGAYTRANVAIVQQTHQQNLLIMQDNFHLADDLARLREQLVIERTRRQPTHSEDAVA